MAPGKPAPGPQEAPPATPTWVKVIAGIGILILVLLAVLWLTGSGHGPGRHAP